MTNANEQEQKRPLTLARTGARLELRKSVETGQVRQSFSHGRSKTVTVEVRKKRTLLPGGAPEPTTPAGATSAGVTPAGTGTGTVSPAGVSAAGVSTVARAQPVGPARRC